VRRLSADRGRLLAAAVLSACVGLAGGALGAWGIYEHFGPAQRVVNQVVTKPGPAGSNLTVSAVAGQASPGVVEVVTQPMATSSLVTGTGGFANGFVVSSDGLIVTTVHAVEGATALRVATADGHAYAATIVRSDAAHGVVVLRASGAQGLTPLSVSTAAAAPGDLVIAVAHPPFSSLVVSSGTVSATNATITLSDGEPMLSDVITVDDTPDARADGAPLINGAGDVVGVVVAAGSASAGVVALDADAVSALVAQAHGGASAQPTLGAQSLLLDPATAAAASSPPGALITNVNAGGPAAQTGLAAGDVVTAVDGTAIDAGHAFDAVKLDLQPEQQITLSVWRGGATLTLTLTVGAA